MNGVKSSWTERAYHYDEGWKLMTNFLWNLELNWFNLSIFIEIHFRNKYFLSQISSADKTAVSFYMP
jgi:hypothetical protein